MYQSVKIDQNKPQSTKDADFNERSCLKYSFRDIPYRVHQSKPISIFFPYKIIILQCTGLPFLLNQKDAENCNGFYLDFFL